MSAHLETLTDEQKGKIRSKARMLTQAEIDERFIETDEKVVFKILRKTDRALAGVLDVDLSEEDIETRDLRSEAGLGLDEKRAVLLEQTLADQTEDYEITEITLISPEDFDYDPELSQEDEEAAKPIDTLVGEFQEYYTEDRYIFEEMGERDAETSELPYLVDHRPNQSPVKDQGSRGTCVSHASVALLEEYDHIPDDLSEQYTHYKFNEFLERPHNTDSGLRTTDAAPFLARSDGRICLERDWPYISNQNTINQLVGGGTYAPPRSATDNQTYGYGHGAYKIIPDRGLTAYFPQFKLLDLL